jgi:hypothetical protein
MQCIESSSDAAIRAKFDSLQRLHAANPEVVPNHMNGVNSQMKITGPRVKSQESKEKERKREKEKEGKRERGKELGTAAVALEGTRKSKWNIATYGRPEFPIGPHSSGFWDNG